MNENGMETYRKVGLPALAVLETILTKGKSPGTTALGQQAALQSSDERKEALRKAALEEKLYGYKTDEYEAGKQERTAKRTALEKRAQIQSETEAEYNAAATPDEQTKAIRKGLMKIGEYGALMPKEKNAFDMDEFVAKLQAQDAISAAKEERAALRAKEAAETTKKNVDKGFKIPGYTKTADVGLNEIERKNLREGMIEYEDFKNTLKEYKALVSKHGTIELVDREAAGSMDALSKNLQLKIKNLAQLGVLSFSDIPFIEKQIPAPGFFKTQAGMLGALETTGRSMDSKISKRLELSGFSPMDGVPSFGTPEEAAKANLAPGTEIRVGGRKAVWE